MEVELRSISPRPKTIVSLQRRRLRLQLETPCSKWGLLGGIKQKIVSQITKEDKKILAAFGVIIPVLHHVLIKLVERSKAPVADRTFVSEVVVFIVGKHRAMARNLGLSCLCLELLE